MTVYCGDFLLRALNEPILVSANSLIRWDYAGYEVRSLATQKVVNGFKWHFQKMLIVGCDEMIEIRRCSRFWRAFDFFYPPIIKELISFAHKATHYIM